jgi:CRP-like cAMP-binding protein
MDKRELNQLVKERIVLLRKAPLFSRVNDKGLKAIARSAVVQEIDAGTKIVSEGKTGVGFYLILEGSVRVVRGEEELAVLKKGDFFGEMALLDSEPRSADVIANEDTRCLVLKRWDMKGIVATNPEVALRMLEEVARRLRQADSELS